jgi:hypothetical protein
MTKFISHFGEDNDAAATDELFLMRLRHWRNTELARTDWTQIEDAPVNKAAWASYRQSLRDLPSSNSDVRKIELPVAP